MSRDVKYPKIQVQLTGNDGNAFAILGAVKRDLRTGLIQEYGMTPGDATEECDKFYAEATAGDYNDLLRACMRWVDVS